MSVAPGRPKPLTHARGGPRAQRVWGLLHPCIVRAAVYCPRVCCRPRSAPCSIAAPALEETALLRLLESPRVLFWVPTLIWASTWHVILYQLAETPPLNAVGWRFLLAGLVLLGVSIARGERWRLELRWHGWVVLGGVVQY